MSTAGTLGELRRSLSERPELSAVIAASSFLVDGGTQSIEDPLPDGSVVDVLPPFAGG
jgi:sulfur-carrier protein